MEAHRGAERSMNRSMVQGAAWESKRSAATDMRQEQAHSDREPTVRGPNKPEPQKWGGHKHTVLGAYNKDPKIASSHGIGGTAPTVAAAVDPYLAIKRKIFV